MRPLRPGASCWKAFLLLAALAPAATAGDFSTSFVDVKAEGVAANEKVLLPQDLDLRNAGPVPLEVRIEVLRPTPEQLRGGAEILPEPQWIRVEPSSFTLAPGKKQECRVQILVPSSARGRCFQAMIHSRAKPVLMQSLSISAGLLSRLRITVKP